MKPKLSLVIFIILVLAVLTACKPVRGVFDVEIQPASEIVVLTEETEDALPAISPLDELKPVVLAILRGSYLDVKALVRYTTTPCTSADGLGGPPKCLPTEADGTLIDAFLLGGSEAHFVRPTEIEPSLQFSVKGLYAVYHVQPNPNKQIDSPTGEYALVFDRDQNDYPLPIIAYVTDDKLVSLDFKMGVSPQEIIDGLSLSDIVVAPTEVEDWLADTEIVSQSTVSDTPVGNWLATSMIVYRPNLGGQMYRNLTITTVEGSTPITVVDEWLPDVGAGFTFPRPLSWSQTNPVMYWTNTPTPDGCAIFANGYDLHKLDLTTGESTSLLEEGGLWLAVSHDETQVAYVNGTTLTLHTFATGEERTVALPEGQAGGVLWAPSDTQLVLTIAENPCGDPALNTTAIVRVDVTTLDVFPLINNSFELLSTQSWDLEEVVLIADKGSGIYHLDPIDGNYWPIDGIAGSNSDWSIYNQLDIPFSFEYPATWSIDDNGLRQANQEILVIPPDAEAFTAYFSVLIDDRSLEQIQAVYAEMPDVEMSTTIIASQEAIQFSMTNSQHVEYFIPYGGRIYLVSTDRPDLPEVQQILESFRFIVP